MTDEQLYSRAAEACNQAAELFSAHCNDEAYAALMKALYASDKLRFQKRRGNINQRLMGHR
jgi:hypothetical protein